MLVYHVSRANLEFVIVQSCKESEMLYLCNYSTVASDKDCYWERTMGEHGNMWFHESTV